LIFEWRGLGVEGEEVRMALLSFSSSSVVRGFAILSAVSIVRNYAEKNEDFVQRDYLW